MIVFFNSLTIFCELANVLKNALEVIKSLFDIYEIPIDLNRNFYPCGIILRRGSFYGIEAFLWMNYHRWSTYCWGSRIGRSTPVFSPRLRVFNG